MAKNTAYLGIGANLGDREASLRKAVRWIGAQDGCRLEAASSLYSTEPVGLEEQPVFLNAVVQIVTTLCPQDLLGVCRATEEKMGRARTIKWGPRVIDIDILLFDQVQLHSEDLTIPHPRMAERAFVLVPLAELVPDLVLPDGRTIAEAAAEIGVEGVELVKGPEWIG